MQAASYFLNAFLSSSNTAACFARDALSSSCAIFLACNAVTIFAESPSPIVLNIVLFILHIVDICLIYTLCRSIIYLKKDGDNIMALITCPECNKEVSDKAEMCPHCGYKLPKPEPMIQGVYCPSCLDSHIKISVDICPFCHIKYRDSVYGTVDEVYNYGKNHPELKESPEFSQEAYNKRINYVPGDYISVNSPECPTCHSKNVQRISGIERGASIIGLGIFSKKINKSFKCKNCGYMW